MIIITLDTEVFLSLGVGGPWGSGLANIKCVVADILHGAAVILHGAAIIFCSMASILSNVPDILLVQHQVVKNWSSYQKTDNHFLGKGGGQTLKW